MTEPTEDGSADGDPPTVPLADLAERVGDRRNRSKQGDVAAQFEDQAFDALSTESIWDAPDGASPPEFGAVGRVVDAGERTHVVSKRNFCERCPHFSDPPQTTCTNDGTEIREFVDKDHVRVHDCPVVDERESAVD